MTREEFAAVLAKLSTKDWAQIVCAEIDRRIPVPP